MKRLAVLALVLASCGAPDALDDAVVSEEAATIPTKLGGRRPARVIVPSNWNGKTKLPLVLLLGGYGYTAAELDEWFRVSSRVNVEGFALVLPDGKRDSGDAPFWNATELCCDYDGQNPNDVAYLAGLIAEAKKKLVIDPKRVSIFGHSNGAFMAYRMACDHPELISAIASVAGSEFADPARCSPDRPVSVLQIHGTSDEIMPIAGDDEAPGARAVLKRWAGHDGCTVSRFPALSTKRNYEGASTRETTVYRYAGCDAKSAVELWSMTGVDHYPDVNAAFTGDVVKWLLAHGR